MVDEFMADATSVLLAYMKAQKISPTFKYGQLAVGLEVVSLIRTLESLPVVSIAEKEGTIATLYTLLRENGLEGAYEAYDGLAKWRRPTFVPEPSLPAIDGAFSRRAPDRRESDDDSSSPRVAPDPTPIRRGKPRAPLWGHPNQELGASPRPVQLALPFGAEQERPSV